MDSKKEKRSNVVKEFKAFVARGNVLDMAVGVIIGGSFNAIVTALVSILISVCTWAVPGGINGLVTVLPALNASQKGLNPDLGLGQKFASGELQDLAETLANETYSAAVVAANPTLIENVKTTILGKYTLYGKFYVYNLSSSINWGAFINAIISFVLIALTLFVIVKVAAKFSETRARIKKEIEEKLAKEEVKEEAKAE